MLRFLHVWSKNLKLVLEPLTVQVLTERNSLARDRLALVRQQLAAISLRSSAADKLASTRGKVASLRGQLAQLVAAQTRAAYQIKRINKSMSSLRTIQ